MTLDETMQALSALGNAQTKKIYLSHGAHEPLFGVKTGDLRVLKKQIKHPKTTNGQPIGRPFCFFVCKLSAT